MSNLLPAKQLSNPIRENHDRVRGYYDMDITRILRYLTKSGYYDIMIKSMVNTQIGALNFI